VRAAFATHRRQQRAWRALIRTLEILLACTPPPGNGAPRGIHSTARSGGNASAGISQLYVGARSWHRGRAANSQQTATRTASRSTTPHTRRHRSAATQRRGKPGDPQAERLRWMSRLRSPCPAHQETRRVIPQRRQPHGHQWRQLWEPISSRGRVAGGAIVSTTGWRPHRTRRDPLVRGCPDATQRRLVGAAPSAPARLPRCDARHPGGPGDPTTRTTASLPPATATGSGAGTSTAATALPGSTKSSVRSDNICGCWAPRSGCAYDAVVTGFLLCGHLWAEGGKTAVGVPPPANGPAARGLTPAGHREGGVQRIPAVRGGLSEAVRLDGLSASTKMATLCGAVMPISRDSSTTRSRASHGPPAQPGDGGG